MAVSRPELEKKNIWLTCTQTQKLCPDRVVRPFRGIKNMFPSGFNKEQKYYCWFSWIKGDGDSSFDEFV